MTDPDAPDSPLEAAADVTGPRATETFALLGNETRLAILLALWEAYEPFAGETWDPTEEEAVPFPALKERVGLADADRLGYHLAKLEGEFVEEIADGYQLLTAGHKLVRTVIASAGFEEAALAPTEVDVPCQHCGGPTAITYRNQRLYHLCTECDGTYDLGENHPAGVLGGWTVNPTALLERGPEAIYAAAGTEVNHEFAKCTGSVCPECTGRLDVSFDVCEAHDPPEDRPCPECGRRWATVARFACTVCKETSVSNLPRLCFYHPVGVAFAWDHGHELGYGSRDLETNRWVSKLAEGAEEEVLSTDPPRIRVTLRHEGDEVSLTFDESLAVVEVREDY